MIWYARRNNGTCSQHDMHVKFVRVRAQGVATPERPRASFMEICYLWLVDCQDGAVLFIGGNLGQHDKPWVPL